MANQTITTNTNFDSLTGLLAGETTTVNNSAILTINSDPQLNRVLPGDITLTDGELYIDGTTVRQINFTGASSLPVLGDTLTSGSVSGQIIGVAGTTTSGSVRLRSLNGIITNGATLTFTGGKTATASSDDSVGWLRVLGTETKSIITTRQGRFKVRGAWYQLGVSNGTASQTFQHYTTDILPVCWIETGLNTGIYEIWLNAGSRWIDSIGLNERGKFFSSVNGNATITFGNGTNGNIPVNGAKIRVPNISLGSALTTASTTGTINTTITNRYKTNTTSSGELDINLCLGSGFYLVSSKAYLINLSNCGFLQSISISETTTTCTLTTVGVGINLAIQTQSFIFNALSSLSIFSCSGASYRTISTGSVLTCANSQHITLKDSSFFSFARDSTLSDVAELSLCDSVTIQNCYFVGAMMNIVTCKNITILNNIFSDTASGGDSSTFTQPSIIIESGSSNIKIDGVSFVGGKPRVSFVTISSSDNIKIRNIGSSITPLDFGNQIGILFESLGNNTSIEVSRCYVTNVRQNLKSDRSTDSFFTYLNIAGDYTDPISNNAANTRISGFGGGNNSFNNSTGIAFNNGGVYGSHFYDYFFSSTLGGVAIGFNEKTSNEPSINAYTIISGTPVFNSASAVLMRTIGDQIIWTYPWFVFGHTGFLNSAFAFSGTNQNNHSFEYDLDKGSGFSGTYKTVNGANLSAETIDYTIGFRVRLKITCIVTNLSNAINGLYLRTTTTATAQQTLYPIDLTQATLTLTGLKPNSEVRIYRSSDSFELGGVENSGTTFSYTYTHTGTDLPVDIVVHSLGYQYLRLTSYPLTVSNASIPIQQQLDRSYSNL